MADPLGGLIGTKVLAISILVPLPPGMQEQDALRMGERGLAVTFELGKYSPAITASVLDRSALPPGGGGL
ncbi:MAG: hypothetical protein GY906_38710 [bacterium]|nr:hypothetical protein [bacterium]